MTAKEPPMDREEIAQRIRERLRSGDLPRQRQARMWGGSGAGLPCRGCGEVIATDDLEIEVQFLTADGFSARRFHTLCYAVWEMERHED
jgi:hypothetical protein